MSAETLSLFECRASNRVLAEHNLWLEAAGHKETSPHHRICIDRNKSPAATRTRPEHRLALDAGRVQPWKIFLCAPGRKWLVGPCWRKSRHRRAERREASSRLRSTLVGRPILPTKFFGLRTI